MDLIPSPSVKNQTLAGMFTWGSKAKHFWVMSTNVLFSKVCWQLPAFAPQANFPTHNLNFHWRWRWWDWIQATSYNLFYFNVYFYIMHQVILGSYTFIMHLRVDEDDMSTWNMPLLEKLWPRYGREQEGYMTVVCT